MRSELVIIAPTPKDALEIVRRMHPEATVARIEYTGRATRSDVVYFHEYAKANNKRVPFGARANRGKAA